MRRPMSAQGMDADVGNWVIAQGRMLNNQTIAWLGDRNGKRKAEKHLNAEVTVG